MSLAPQPQPLDDERRAVQQRLERAVGEGRPTLDGFTERCGLVWAAGDAGLLQRRWGRRRCPARRGCGCGCSR